RRPATDTPTCAIPDRLATAGPEPGVPGGASVGCRRRPRCPAGWWCPGSSGCRHRKARTSTPGPSPRGRDSPPPASAAVGPAAGSRGTPRSGALNHPIRPFVGHRIARVVAAGRELQQFLAQRFFVLGRGLGQQGPFLLGEPLPELAVGLAIPVLVSRAQ